jgi:very-short-patch-repair endonuclease
MDANSQVAELAERQHGVVARWQLRLLGFDRHVIQRRLRTGRWQLVGRGVLLMSGAPRSPEQIVMVAVLEGGKEAIASHAAAAWLWRLPGFGPTDDVIRARYAYAGPNGHRPRLLPAHHRTTVRGIASTSLPRTIFDLAGVLPLGRTARLVDTVVTRSPAMLPALHGLLPELARRGRGGITVMRTLLDERPIGTKVPASGLEARFEQICRNAGISGLERQVDVGGHSWLGRVDYLRRDVGLLIEVDSVLHHTSVTDRANDAARDQAMLASGYRRVERVAEEDIWRRPWMAVEQLLTALAELQTTAA